MRNNQYATCSIEISRNVELDKFAFDQPGRRISRARSVQNEMPLPEIAEAPRRPLLDMQKIRSILKNPIDKPRSIFLRRNSMSAVRFTDNANDIAAPVSSAQTGTLDSHARDDQPLIDLSNVQNDQHSNSVQPPVIMQPTQVCQPNLLADELNPLTVELSNAQCSKRRPVPDLIHYGHLSQSTKSNESTSVQWSNRRPIPNLIRTNPSSQSENIKSTSSMQNLLVYQDSSDDSNDSISEYFRGPLSISKNQET